MAQEIIARGQISIIDLNDAKSLNMYLRTDRPTTQIYNTDTKSFTPSWTESPYLTITPELFVSGTTANQMSQVLVPPVYKINGLDVSEFGGTVSQVSPYTLTIKKNMETCSQMRIECSAIYTDPDIASFETPVKADIQFTKTTNAGATICAIAYTPLGNVFKNDQTSTLEACCDLWRGSIVDRNDVKYTWYKMGPNGKWKELVEGDSFGCTGFNTRKLIIPAGAVLNFDTFKCEIVDDDKASNTYNKSVADVLSFFDQSDPYYVEVYSSTGDKIVNGQGSTVLSAKVWQAGECFSELDADAKFTFKWQKFNSNGDQDINWGAHGEKTGASITVNASEISSKAMFVCNLYNKI